MGIRKLAATLRHDSLRRNLLVTVAAGLVIAGVGLTHSIRTARAQITGNSPVATITTGVTTGAVVQIVGYNPSRRAIQICVTTAMNVTPVNPAGMTPAPPTTGATGNGIPIAAGACLTTPLNLLASGSAAGGGAAWQAIAQTSTGNVTVLEY